MLWKGFEMMVNKVRRYLRTLKIRQQILCAMITIAVLSSVILGAVAFNISKYIIERNYKEAYTYHLEVSSNIIDFQLENIIDSVRNALLDDRLIGVLNRSESYSGKMFSSSDDLQLSRGLTELAGMYTEIEGISVFSKEGKGKFYYKRHRSGNFQKYYDTMSALDGEWVEETDAYKGRERFYGYDVLLGQDHPYFSMTKKLIEPFSGEFVGYMVVSLRYDVFEKAFGKAVERYVSVGSMVVHSKETPVIVFNNCEEDVQDDMESAYLKQGTSSIKYIFSNFQNRTTGWELVNAIHTKDLEKDSVYIGMLIVATLFGLVFMSFFIAQSIAGYIYRPLNQLAMVIEKVGEGKRDLQETFDETEIGKLGHQFQQMVMNNLELRERLLNAQLHEREAELLLLQAQINPHFLYNTLDSLYCMAMIEDNEKIASMVEALSNIFKLSLNKGKTLIKVMDEIQHIKAYMAIQNYRFNERFDVQMDLDPLVLEGYIIKLILQPFVENAIQHGLEKKVGAGYVRIEGQLLQNRIMCFKIIDNGVGIDDVSCIQKGYGIQNVKERIRLCYGEEYGVSIQSQKGAGTIVTLNIPFHQKPYEEVGHDHISSV